MILDPLRDELFTVREGERRARRRAARGSRRDDLATAMVATGFGYDAGVRAAQAAVVARLLPQSATSAASGRPRSTSPGWRQGATTPTTSTASTPGTAPRVRCSARAVGPEVRHLDPPPGAGPGLLVAAPAIADALEALTG